MVIDSWYGDATASRRRVPAMNGGRSMVPAGISQVIARAFAHTPVHRSTAPIWKHGNLSSSCSPAAFVTTRVSQRLPMKRSFVLAFQTRLQRRRTRWRHVSSSVLGQAPRVSVTRPAGVAAMPWALAPTARHHRHRASAPHRPQSRQRLPVPGHSVPGTVRPRRHAAVAACHLPVAVGRSRMQ
jgi:hypothetical protein